MLRLQPAHERDAVWDALLPAGVSVLPADLARVDELLSEPELLAPFRTLWRARDAASGGQASSFGRPTIAMATYVRLMVLRSRTGWGYATLVREVSDSLHPAAVLPHPADRSGTDQVDGPQAHPAARA
jgi:IS5 family transposase